MPRWLTRLLCRVGIHDRRIVHDWIPGVGGAPGRYEESVKCWACGRRCP